MDTDSDQAIMDFLLGRGLVVVYQGQMKGLKSSNKQPGMSLVELMVALAISATLLSGVAQVLAGMRQTERAEDALSRMQEAARSALIYLGEEIQQAGFGGCISRLPEDRINNIMLASTLDTASAKGVQGWNADLMSYQVSVEGVATTETTTGWTAGGSDPELPGTFQALPGSDIVKVWGVSDPLASELEGNILAVNTDTETRVEITPLDAKDNDILIFSDCNRVDRVQACTVTDSGASLVATLSADCSSGNLSPVNLTTAPGARVHRLTANTYYVGKRSNQANNPPALFYRPLQTGGNPPAASIELVEGIANVQLLFGENLDHDLHHSTDAWLNADEVTDWSRIISVRISVLVESVEDNLVATPASYNFAGNSYMPTDRKMRRVFSTTVSIRNQVL